MFDFSTYRSRELVEIKKATETLIYYGFGEFIRQIDNELRKRGELIEPE